MLGLSAVLVGSVETSDVDPVAIDLLHRTTEYVGGLERFSVHAQSTYEDRLQSGHRIDYEMWATTTVRRPDRLRTERHGNHINQIFYYDGRSLVLHNPADEVYAREAAPGTIDEMFQFAHDTLGLGSPISDLVHRDPFPLLMQDVNLALVVGREVIRGALCDHLLFSRPDVDFQVWIAAEGPPVPLKYLVTDTTTPELLSVSAFLSNWNPDPAVPDSLFEFTPPAGTLEIPFIKTDSPPGLDR